MIIDLLINLVIRHLDSSYLIEFEDVNWLHLSQLRIGALAAFDDRHLFKFLILHLLLCLSRRHHYDIVASLSGCHTITHWLAILVLL